MYRRYTLDEVKHKITSLLQGNSAGLSGVELAEKTGINRMTMSKYLNVLLTLGLVRRKKAGPVNIWYLNSGITDLEFPINYLEIQQNYMTATFQNDPDKSHGVILSALNSTPDKIKVLSEVIIPTYNTLNELYDRGRLGETERTSILTTLAETIELIKFNLQVESTMQNAHVLFVAGSEDRIVLAKSGALELKMLGWNSSYIGNVERLIDPFFDIDFQRYIIKSWNEKRGLMILCIFSSQESSLRFLSLAASSLKSKLKGELYTVIFTTSELAKRYEDIGADAAFNNIQSLVEWCEKKYSTYRG
ncbi:MAG: winged helix-turn-helix domain-containing protein [Thermoproteota archaeon]|nr:winged helix-turn-helix domain-containing protein [Thermoproteota archaeon]